MQNAKTRTLRQPRTAIIPDFSKAPLICFALLFGKVAVVRAEPASGHKAVSPRPVQKTKPAAKSVIPVEAAAPAYDNGAGLLVGEPVVAPQDQNTQELASFGAACSRWLQFYVGGQGELGKTPLWSQVESMRLEMARPDLQLSRGDIPRVVQSLGVTQLLLGSIHALSPDHFSLQYEQVDCSAQPGNAPNPVAASKMTLEGTKTEIWKQLPALAVSLSTKLGVKTPHIAVQAELSETEISLLGRGTWTHAGKMTTDDLGLLTGVAAKEPLAGLLDLEYIVHQGLNTDWQYQFALQGQKSETFCDSPLKTQLVQNLMANAGQNVLVPVEIADIDVNQLLPYKSSPYRDALAKADHDFPENYAVKAVATDVDLRAFGATGELDLAQRVVLAAPQNPYAWLELGQFAASKASSLREGQTVNTIDAVSVTQRGQLNSVNAVWESAARKAVTLNPLSEPGWRMLAEAATFNGKTADASNAFWKAYQIDPADSSILNWGLKQFQPKKGGDSASWQKVISLASVPQHVTYIGANLYHVLYDSGQITAANNIWGMADKVFANEKDGKSDDLEKLSLWIAFQEGMGSATYFETKHLTELLPHSSVAFWMEGTQWISFIPLTPRK